MSKSCKRRGLLVASATILAAALAACAAPAPLALSGDDLTGQNIAVIKGVLTTNTTTTLGGTPVEYADTTGALADLRAGVVDGYMHAASLIRALAAADSDFTYQDVPRDVFSAQLAAFATDQALVDQFNEFLATANSTGITDDLAARYLADTAPVSATIPAGSGENGVLRVVTTDDALPFAFTNDDGDLTGYSVELAQLFANSIGKTAEFTTVPFADLISTVADGGADLGIANVAITPERAQQVIFTDPYYDEGHATLRLAE